MDLLLDETLGKNQSKFLILRTKKLKPRRLNDVPTFPLGGSEKTLTGDLAWTPELFLNLSCQSRLRMRE